MHTFVHHVRQTAFGFITVKELKYCTYGLTGAVLVISVPGDGSYKVDAGKSCHETLETMSLASFRAIRPVPEGTGCVQS